MNPQSAKLRFRLRPLSNYLIVLTIFIPLVFLGTRSAYSCLIDIVLILLLAFLNFAILEKRAIEIICTGCHRPITTNTPWVCGFCKKKNQNVDDFPLIHRCEHCTAETKAYKCHHKKDDKKCGHLIFLTKDCLEENYASCLNTSGDIPIEQERSERERERFQKEHAILMADLDEKLLVAKERHEFIRKKTPREAEEAHFEKFHGSNMAVEEIAFEKEAQFREKYKNDERMLKRSLESLNAWVESRKG